MGWFKDTFSTGMAGLEAIEDSRVHPIVRLQLLNIWTNPRPSKKALHQLRGLIATKETEHDRSCSYKSCPFNPSGIGN